MLAKRDFLKTTFPQIIESIKLYISLDNDFEMLCNEFVELSDLIYHLEKSDVKYFDKIKIQIVKYKQLQKTLIGEINNFIIEEEKNKTKQIL